MNLVAQLSQFSGQLSVAKIVLATEPYEPQLQSALLGALIAAVAMLGYLRWRNRPSGWRSLSVRQKELLGQAVFAASPDAILVLDPHDKKVPMRIVDCNDQVCALHGLSRDQLIGQSIDIIEADRCWTSAGAMQVMEEIRLVRFRSGETLHKHSDGSTFPVEYSNSVIVLDGRELLLGFDRDIRVRKQA
jgi:PAS domain S-box-containing protein